MKISIVGAGPAGLYLSILLKRDNPAHDITIYERNRADDTFGFGVVFSDETLSQFLGEDEGTYRDIIDNFAWWDEIDVVAGAETIRSGGHGFCGIARQKLLDVLQRRAAGLGVKLLFQHEVTDFEAMRRDCDLLVGADGINSLVRETWKDEFRPSFDWRRNKFVWLGTTKPLKTFTFVFRENQDGLFQVHAYQFNKDTATWIVETTEDAWLKAGLDKATEADTVAYCQKLFEKDLDGHPLITNRSLWRTFPTIKCERWVHGNVVLMGDAVHTAHFSIGSGTKLAMEDAIALATAIRDNATPAAGLAAYENKRRDEASLLQHTAQVSLEWFEETKRYRDFEPIQLALSLLSRSKRITYDNLRLRDPAFMGAIDRWFAGQVTKQTGIAISTDNPPPPMFTPFKLRGLTLANRVVVSPMCQYSAEDGLPNDWHMVHLGSRAVGGAGLIITEMTDVSAEARITPGCTGLWNDDQVKAWRRITDFVHGSSAGKICVQLAHAGRKGATCLPWEGGYDQPLQEGAWEIIAASPLPYYPHSQVPREMTRADMDRVRDDFAAAARRAVDAGFDMVEVHMAHGYLLASFISPLTNQRSDEYGGSIENRMRFPLEVFDAVRAAWPADRPISVRVSATDWVPDAGLSPEDSVAVGRMLKAHGCDIVDVSAGQTTADARPVYGRMFQTPFADQIRQEVGIATMAVGAITSADQVNTIVASGRADLCCLARPHLADPYFTLHASAEYGFKGQAWPRQYVAGRDQAFSLADRERQDMAELRKLATPKRPEMRRLDAAE